MTEDQLKEGKELLTLISATRDALNTVTKLLLLNDHYFLAISQHKDGSGVATALCRKRGNQELLAIIQTELKRQLSKYEAEFASL